jgi:hypothetical protein
MMGDDDADAALLAKLGLRAMTAEEPARVCKAVALEGVA